MFDVRAVSRGGPVAQRLEQGIITQRRLFAQFFRMLRSLFFRADQRQVGSHGVASRPLG
jgi:hypothetical protein